MKTASQILADRHISIRSTSEGNKKTLCPQCSATRKHRRDPCLSVTIDRTGVRFFCHNCNFSGGSFYDEVSTSYSKPKQQRISNGYEKSIRAMSHGWRL